MARSAPVRAHARLDGPAARRQGSVAIEPKWDGYRCLLYLNDPEGSALRVHGRSGRPLTDSVPELTPLAAAAGVDAVLNGELIVTDGVGRPDFTPSAGGC